MSNAQEMSNTCIFCYCWLRKQKKAITLIATPSSSPAYSLTTLPVMTKVSGFDSTTTEGAS